MAFGVPIVGTDAAFQGLYKSENFLYKAMDTEAGFAAGITELYHENTKWQVASSFNLAYVNTHFNKENMINVLKSTFAL
jgi:hypothetical protein